MPYLILLEKSAPMPYQILLEPWIAMEPVAKLLQKFVVAMEPVTKLLQPALVSSVILQEPFVGVVLAALLSL
jgi:hypothetical protein